MQHTANANKNEQNVQRYEKDEGQRRTKHAMNEKEMASWCVALAQPEMYLT